MKIQTTKIAGCVLVEPQVFGDERGFFMETFRSSRFIEHGLPGNFVQDNFSRSVRGTLRGLHYQIREAQGKLVQVVRGEVYDVAVDLRQDSPTFGQWEAVTLTEADHKQFYIPPGCAHGFLVLSDSADFAYKCTKQYNPEAERVLLWNDSELAIEWPLSGEPILSEKDRAGTPFCRCETYAVSPQENETSNRQ